MITFKIEQDGNEFHAWVPELPGCHTHGRTVSEAMHNLKDAVQLYLEVKMEEEIAKQTLEFVEL
jgi:predicted RNase H-like HicB family nuclease